MSLRQELVCLVEDAFDSLAQGGGCTCLAVLAVRQQRVGLKGVESFDGEIARLLIFAGPLEDSD